MSKRRRVNRGRQYIPYAKGFMPPTSKDRLQAIGDNDVLLREFDPDPRDGFHFFRPVSPPSHIDDWLAQYSVKGQTFTQYIEKCRWINSTSSAVHRDVSKHKRIYLLPIGKFDSEHCVDFSDLAEFANLYIGLPVIQLTGIDLEICNENGVVHWLDQTNDIDFSRTKIPLTTRYSTETKHYQIHVDYILHLLKQRNPPDAVCIIGLTMSDLYGGDPDLFVAGMARGGSGVAVFSFYRYDPKLKFSVGDWYDVKHVKSRKISDSQRKLLILQRSCKLLVHEICHLLGIAHCIFYECCMNGSGHLAEDFRQPIHLCPVDLHKLQTLVKFDVVERYKALCAFYVKHSMREEAEWVTRRVAAIEQNKLKNVSQLQLIKGTSVPHINGVART